MVVANEGEAVGMSWLPPGMRNKSVRRIVPRSFRMAAKHFSLIVRAPQSRIPQPWGRASGQGHADFTALKGFDGHDGWLVSLTYFVTLDQLQTSFRQKRMCRGRTSSLRLLRSANHLWIVGNPEKGLSEGSAGRKRPLHFLGGCARHCHRQQGPERQAAGPQGARSQYLIDPAADDGPCK
jgi:hypothetical protein